MNKINVFIYIDVKLDTQTGVRAYVMRRTSQAVVGFGGTKS